MLTGPNVALANREVKAEVLRPFWLRRDGKMVETKPGETIQCELWLANQLAKHSPPKIGPIGTYAKQQAEKDAAAKEAASKKAA